MQSINCKLLKKSHRKRKIWRWDFLYFPLINLKIINALKKEDEEDMLKKVKLHDKLTKEEEEREEGAISSQTALTYIRAMGLFIFFWFMFSLVFKEAARTVSDFWLKSKITPGDTSFSFLDSWSDDFVNMYAYQMIIVMMINLFSFYLYFVYATKTAKRIFQKLMNSILFSKMSFFDKNETGRIVNRISKDTYIVDEPISACMYNFFNTLFLAVSYSLIAIIQFTWMSVGSYI